MTHTATLVSVIASAEITTDGKSRADGLVNGKIVMRFTKGAPNTLHREFPNIVASSVIGCTLEYDGYAWDQEKRTLTIAYSLAKMPDITAALTRIKKRIREIT